MANIKVLLYDQANNEYDVSYIEEIPLSLSFLISDVSNPAQRNTTFSKTINFNSKDIDLFFRVIWKLNSSLTTFDPRLKCNIKYYVNEQLQLDGDLQLIKVVVDPDSKQVNYQTTATGTIGNLFLAIGDKYLTALDFSAYNHALTKANVVNSWTAATGSGYYYGLINWGQNQINGETEYHVKHFRPQLYKREMMSKIFTNAGYTWTSVYLDSAAYKNEVIPPTAEYLNLSAASIATSQFYARRNATQTGSATTCGYVSAWIGSKGFITSEVVLFNEDNVLPYNDSGGNYATGTGIFSPTTTNLFNVSTLVKFDIVFTNDVGTATNCVLNSGQLDVYITQYNGINWQSIAVNSILISSPVVSASLTISGYQIYVNLPSYSMLATENFRVEILGSVNFTLYTAGAVAVTTGNTTFKFNPKTDSTYYANLDNNLITEGATLEVNQCVPIEIKQIDWLTTEIKKANLYIIPNPNKAKDYIIEPRDDGFYTGSDDWSDLFDVGKDYEVLPVSELNTKRYEFWNAQDTDEYNSSYFKQYKQTFGYGYTDCVSDFVKPTKKIELIYAATPIADNNINGLILPKIYKNDNGIIKPMKSAIRQLYRGGLINMSYGSWTLKSSLSGDTIYTNYPFVGDCDTPYAPTLTLNWETPKKIYYKYINATYTNNNLKNKFYSKMINQISDKQSVVVKAYFNLNELKVKEFSFRKVIWVEALNSYFYVQNFEYIMNTQQSTLVTLLKLKEYNNFAPTNVTVPNPEPIWVDRIINGNYSNGTNNTNNGSASRIVGGSNNFISSGAQDIQLENCTGVTVQSNVTSFRGAGLINVVITNSSNSTTIIAPNVPITITSDTILDITYNNRTVFVDATARNITIYWDSVTMNHCTVNFIRADGSANIVYLSDADATVEVMGNSVPYDTSLAPFNQYAALPIIQRLDSGGIKQLYINY